jgi:hypothetical protein
VWNAYARAWKAHVDIGGHLAAFESVSRLLECYDDWQRVIVKTERGEIEGFLEAARRASSARLVSTARRVAAVRVT